MKFMIHVTTNASKNEIIGIFEDVMKIRVCEIPQNGLANKSLQKIISKFFKMPKTHVKILSGHSSKTKLIDIEDIFIENYLLNNSDQENQTIRSYFLNKIKKQ